MPSELCTIAEVAERLRFNERTVRRLIASGQLTIVRIGSSVRIPLDDVDRLITERTVPVPPVSAVSS